MKVIGVTSSGSVIVEMHAKQVRELKSVAERLGAMAIEIPDIECGDDGRVRLSGAAPLPEPSGRGSAPAPAKPSKAGRRVPRPPKKKSPAGPAAPTLRKLPDGKVSVTPHLIDILRAENRAMTVPELAAAFKTRTGLDHYKKVGIALATLNKHFERVGKGVYRLAVAPAAGGRNVDAIREAARRVEEKGL